MAASSKVMSKPFKEARIDSNTKGNITIVCAIERFRSVLFSPYRLVKERKAAPNATIGNMVGDDKKLVKKFFPLNSYLAIANEAGIPSPKAKIIAKTAVFKLVTIPFMNELKPTKNKYHRKEKLGGGKLAIKPRGSNDSIIAIIAGNMRNNIVPNIERLIMVEAILSKVRLLINHFSPPLAGFSFESNRPIKRTNASDIVVRMAAIAEPRG